CPAQRVGLPTRRHRRCREPVRHPLGLPPPPDAERPHWIPMRTGSPQDGNHRALSYVGVSQWRVGDVSITRVIEVENALRGTWLVPDATPEAVPEVAWLRPLFAEEQGRLRMSAHSLVVRSGGLTILVDTGIGNDKDRPDVPGWHQRHGSYLADLAAA